MIEEAEAAAGDEDIQLISEGVYILMVNPVISSSRLPCSQVYTMRYGVTAAEACKNHGFLEA